MPFIAQQLSADGVATEGRNIVTEAIHDIITAAFHVHSLSVSPISPEAQGYAVGDTFSLTSIGTPVNVNGDDFHATGRVTEISAVESPELGIPTLVEIISWGAYSAITLPSPLNSPDTVILAASTTNITGSGNGNLLVDFVIDTGKWTSDDYTINSPFTQNEWLASSVKVANAPVVGMRSQLGVGDAVRMTIGSSYSGILPWDGQPGVPPTDNFYFAVPNQDPFLYVSSTERRVNVMVTNGAGSYQYASAGLFIPFVDVASNYPFPGFIAGQSTTVQGFTDVYPSDNRGIINPINFSSLGCYQYRDNLSSEWFGMTENNGNGAQVCKAQIWPNTGIFTSWSLNYAPVPTGSSALTTHMVPTINGPNMFFAEEIYFQADAISSVGPVGPAPLGIGVQLHFTVQALIISNQAGDVQQIGIIDGLEALHGRGLIGLDEIQNQDGRRYIAFPDTASSSLTNWVAMEMI